MSKYCLNDAVPHRLISVGDVISDELKEVNMKQIELASLIGTPRSVLNDVIKGKRALTPQMAVLIEKAIGTPADFLLSTQSLYEIDKVRKEKQVIERSAMTEIWLVLKEYISIPFFKKNGIINNDVVKDVKNIFKVFNVSNLDEFFGIRAKERELSYFRRSDKYTTNPIDIFSWKYYCYYLANNDERKIGSFKEYDNSMFKSINDIIYSNTDTIERVKDILYKNGIRLLIVNKLGQVPVDGMSFWIGDNPTIVLTRRISSIDNFAFTLFHELGHVFKHLQKGGIGFINITNESRNETEIEADRFANNAIVDESEWRKFLSKARNIIPYKIAPIIKDESIKLHINPQILFGKYKHDIGLYKIKNPFDTKIG